MSPVTPDWSIVEYRGQDGLRQLEGDWKRLTAAMPDRGFHHLYETHVAYFTHMPSPHGPFTCLALTDGERVRAICPLEPDVVKVLGRSRRAWGLPLSQRDLLRDVICPPDEARRALLPALVSYLRRAPDRLPWLVFNLVLETSAVWQGLRSLDSRTYCTHVVAASDVFNCERPFEDLASGFSRKFRSNLRSAHRKLAALGNARFERATDPPGLAREFEAFLALEASGWKGDAGTTLRQRPDHLALYRDLLARLGPVGQCEINALYAGDRCIASQFCVRAGAEYAILKLCYDEGYPRVAPGQLLLEHTLERCCGDPEIKRATLVSHQGWHQEWLPDVLPVHCVYVPLGRWGSRTVVALLRLRFEYGPRLKQVLQRFGHSGTPTAC
jgi:hypothetical protein